MRRWNICLFINLFVCFLAKGQHPLTARSAAKPTAPYDTIKPIISTQTLMNNSAVSPFSNTLIKTVPSTFYYNSIGFFCKKELQVEKALSFPVKFRLGSVAYTDQMEGKGKGVSFPTSRK